MTFCHVMPLTSAMPPEHLFSQDNQNMMQHW